MAELCTREDPDEAEGEGQIHRPQEADYEVGFGKPPKKHQFKKGRSGNPTGKRKNSTKPKLSSAEFGGLLADELIKPLTVVVDGKKVTKTRVELLAQRLTMLMLKCDSLSQFKSAMDMMKTLNVPGYLLDKVEGLDDHMNAGPWTPELEAKFQQIKMEIKATDERGEFE